MGIQIIQYDSANCLEMEREGCFEALILFPPRRLLFSSKTLLARLGLGTRSARSGGVKQVASRKG